MTAAVQRYVEHLQIWRQGRHVPSQQGYLARILPQHGILKRLSELITQQGHVQFDHHAVVANERQLSNAVDEVLFQPRSDVELQLELFCQQRLARRRQIAPPHQEINVHKLAPAKIFECQGRQHGTFQNDRRDSPLAQTTQQPQELSREINAALMHLPSVLAQSSSDVRRYLRNGRPQSPLEMDQDALRPRDREHASPVNIAGR